MNRTEKKILSATIQTVLRTRRAIWLELKREILDCGYQPEYTTTVEFLEPVERALHSLNEQKRDELFAEWQKRHPTRTDRPESSMLAEYSLLILEEIVKRAKVAADRTNEW